MAGEPMSSLTQPVGKAARVLRVTRPKHTAVHKSASGQADRPSLPVEARRPKVEGRKKAEFRTPNNKQSASLAGSRRAEDRPALPSQGLRQRAWKEAFQT